MTLKITRMLLPSRRLLMSLEPAWPPAKEAKAAGRINIQWILAIEAYPRKPAKDEKHMIKFEDAAAIRFRNIEAEAAWDLANPRSTNSGEKISPPPRPTILSTKEMAKIAVISGTEMVMASTKGFAYLSIGAQSSLEHGCSFVSPWH